jgi:hypothetical protein
LLVQLYSLAVIYHQLLFPLEVGLLCFFGYFNKSGKSFAIVPSKIGKGLTIYGNIGFMQTIYELAISHIVVSTGSINTSNPEATELSFFLFSMSKEKINPRSTVCRAIL